MVDVEVAAGVAVLAVLAVVYFLYDAWKRKAVASQSFTSTADPDLIRDAFERKVATTGWKIIDDGNPMIAQSPLIAGIRQQVALDLTLQAESVRGEYSTLRYVRKMLTGTPTKAVTLAARKSAFFRELDRLKASEHSRPLSPYPPEESQRASSELPPSLPLSDPPLPPPVNAPTIRPVSPATPPALVPTIQPTPLSSHQQLPVSGPSPFAPLAPIPPPPDGEPCSNQAPIPPPPDGEPCSNQPWYATTAGKPVSSVSSSSFEPQPSQDEDAETDPWWES
jgi:hypothetical protein